MQQSNLQTYQTAKGYYFKIDKDAKKVRISKEDYLKYQYSEKIGDLKTSAIKPFLKWVGGKTQLQHLIINNFPKKLNNYHEPFVGGGSILLQVMNLVSQKKLEVQGKIYAYDQNKDLINTYKNIQFYPNEVLNYLDTHFNQYDNLRTSELKKSFYYEMRAKFNNMDKNAIECSAIFLNKICFRGLFRVNSKNCFNVPYGHYEKTPQRLTRKNIFKISTLIKNIEFLNLDFETSLQKVVPNDFIYLDPPYFPTTEANLLFNQYTANGFDLNEHQKLFKMVKELDKKNIYFVLSNSDNPTVWSTFKTFHIKKMEAKRRINSKKPDSKTYELLIYNTNIKK